MIAGKHACLQNPAYRLTFLSSFPYLMLCYRLSTLGLPQFSAQTTFTSLGNILI